MTETARFNGDWEQKLAETAVRAKQEAEQAEQVLLTLASQYSPEAIFAAAFVVMVVAPEGQASEPTHGHVPSQLERLVFQLWRISDPGAARPTGKVIETTIQAIDQLARQSIISQTFRPDSPKDDLESLMVRLSVDAQLIRGSAYPEQTSQEIIEIAGSFNEWFFEKIGATPRDLVDAVFAVVYGIQEQVNGWLSNVFEEARQSAKSARIARGHRGRPTGSQSPHPRQVFNDTAMNRITAEAYSVVPLTPRACVMPDGTQPSAELWNALLSLVGFRREHAIHAGDFLVARSRPLFVFQDGRVLLADLPNALDCLWDSLDAQAKSDVPFYSRFQKRKADWLEEKTTEYFSRVFGEEFVYRDLMYPDPDRPGEEAFAQIDAAIHWGPFLVLVEAKARQFRLAGQLGDVGRLRTDLKRNVEDAFEQAMRAQRYVASVEEACFRERKSDRLLRVRMQRLQRVYLVTVSLHLLGNAINRLANLRALGMFARGDYPWAVSLADLDIITRFVEGPDVLLHYLERRREVEHGEIFPLNDDIDLFGAYLSTRLHPSSFREKGKAPHYIWLAGYQVPFDEWMEFQRGMRKEEPKICLEVPETIRGVLEELRRRRNDDGARWIAFALLGLSSPQLAAVAEGIERGRSQIPKPGMYRRWAVDLDDLAVSIVTTADRPAEELSQRTQIRTAVDKYRRRVSRGIGFGIHLGQQGVLFDSCVWIEGPWESDAEMERLLETEPPFSPAPGQKLPGRNAPCVCGSGKKFKKCCLHRIGVRHAHHW